VNQCAATALAVHGVDTENLVVNVSLFQESARLAQHTGDTLPDAAVLVPHMPGQPQELVSDPAAYVMPFEPILKTRFGNWMGSRKIMGTFLACVGVCLAILEIKLPGAHPVIIEDTSKPGISIELLRLDMRTTCVIIALYCLFFFVTAHIVCKHMVKVCVQYFDPAVITLSGLTIAITWVHEYFTVYPNIGELSKAYWACYIVHKLCHGMIHVFMSMMDAWAISTPAKACVSLMYVSAIGFWFLVFRFQKQWSNRQVCVTTGYCTTPQVLFFAAMANVFVFALKLPLTYCSGYEYAVLRGSYLKRRPEPPTRNMCWHCPCMCAAEKSVSTSFREAHAEASRRCAADATDTAVQHAMETTEENALSKMESQMSDQFSVGSSPQRHDMNACTDKTSFYDPLFPIVLGIPDELQKPIPTMCLPQIGNLAPLYPGSAD